MGLAADRGAAGGLPGACRGLLDPTCTPGRASHQSEQSNAKRERRVSSSQQPSERTLAADYSVWSCHVRSKEMGRLEGDGTDADVARMDTYTGGDATAVAGHVGLPAFRQKAVLLVSEVPPT